MSKLDDALETLKRGDPRRYHRVRMHVRHIFVWPGHYSAQDKFGGMMLSGQLARVASTAHIVGDLVHEATHLRIARQGIRYVQARRARIERLCVEEEIDALLRCDLIDERESTSMREALATPWWTSDVRRKDIERVLATAELPRWTKWFLW